MSEDLIPQPTTPIVDLNEDESDESEMDDESDEDIDMLFEPDGNDMYIPHLRDVHYEDNGNNPQQLYVNPSDITVVRIIKENYDEGTNFKEMMRSIFGNDIAFLDPNNFIF
jgi:hypothetical protein